VTRTTQPHIKPWDDTSQHVIRRLRTIERGITAQPETFLAALHKVGKTALQGSIAYRDINETQTSLERDPEDLIQEYFIQRYDSEAEYDPETEAAIQADDAYQRLRHDHLAQQSLVRKVGAGKSERFDNPHALDIRDALRYRRLEICIAQAALWQAQTTAS
jgi:hypothetical protein